MEIEQIESIRRYFSSWFFPRWGRRKEKREEKSEGGIFELEAKGQISKRLVLGRSISICYLQNEKFEMRNTHS